LKLSANGVVPIVKERVPSAPDERKHALKERGETVPQVTGLLNLQRSSHSGRRTFITNAARTISSVGGSLRDVQMLAGHRALSTTQRYIEADAEAQKRVVDLV
jgi:integrase